MKKERLILLKLTDILEKEKMISVVNKDKNAAVKNQDFEHAANLRDLEKEMQNRLAQMKAEWEKNLTNNRQTVDDEDIAGVVSMISGVPMQRMQQDEWTRLKGMRAKHDALEPCAAPKVAAGVHRHAKQPCLFLARLNRIRARIELDEHVLTDVFRPLPVAQIEICHAQHVVGILVIQLFKRSDAIRPQLIHFLTSHFQ